MVEELPESTKDPPPIHGGEVITMSSKAHNCSINAILAALFGNSTAEIINPYQANPHVTWVFRTLLADQLPENGNFGAISIEDWRRTFIMMFEGPLFKAEEFSSGAYGEGLNLSIEQFKRLRHDRLHKWIHGEKSIYRGQETLKKSSKPSKIIINRKISNITTLLIYLEY